MNRARLEIWLLALVLTWPGRYQMLYFLTLAQGYWEHLLPGLSTCVGAHPCSLCVRFVTLRQWSPLMTVIQNILFLIYAPPSAEYLKRQGDSELSHVMGAQNGRDGI